MHASFIFVFVIDGLVAVFSITHCRNDRKKHAQKRQIQIPQNTWKYVKSDSVDMLCSDINLIGNRYYNWSQANTEHVSTNSVPKSFIKWLNSESMIGFKRRSGAALESQMDNTYKCNQLER